MAASWHDLGRFGLRLRLQLVQRSHRGLGLSTSTSSPRRRERRPADGALAQEVSQGGRTGVYDTDVHNQRGDNRDVPRPVLPAKGKFVVPACAAT
jgi:hypothetical protein